ncbi:MAG: galactose-1-phosphate uridylyltransferase, partial [Candidatus Omnitrophica bacterium]|nr:galactose-1-phosphate uridylyltransferase [Candidatus Omnitrophota bacterium]
IINTAPIQHDQELEFYHWYIEIVPKLTRSAGFEWGTGFYINPTPPEKAALWLREVNLK